MINVKGDLKEENNQKLLHSEDASGSNNGCNPTGLRVEHSRVLMGTAVHADSTLCYNSSILLNNDLFHAMF